MSSEKVGAPIIRRVKSRPSRVRDASPPGEDGEESPAATPETLAIKLKNKQKRSKPKARLSFGTDDQSSDGEVFKVKKSNLSRKLVLGNTPSTPSGSLPLNLDQASISPRTAGPTYTKAYLDELKANTPSIRTTRQHDEDVDPDTSMDASFDLDGAIIENGADLLPESRIPSASAITAAKEKRGRLRGAEGDGDFISLSVSTSGDIPQGPHPESRLMREEDELGEGEEDMAEYTGAQERIALGKKGQKAAAQKKRMGMAEMIEDAEEEDEETIEWERAQIRRAGPIVDELAKKPKPTYKPAPIPSVTPVPNLNASLARLTAAMTNLTTSHTSHTSALSSLADERLALETKEAEMRQMVEQAEIKRSWFVAFREWVESVASFLDEKYPPLEKLEDEHVSLIAERRDMISDRRKLDDEDDIIVFLGLPPVAKTLANIEVIDELGRTIPSNNTVKATRVSRRNARSNRRVLRRARNQAQKQEEDGYSTDGSLPPTDTDDFRMAIAKLEERREAILSDVRADEFRDPQAGLAKWFGEWRAIYEESYVGAWGGLGLVAAWEFWCRLEMVGWDPIEDPSRDLDTFEWSVALHEYSRPRKNSQMNIDDDIEPDIGPGGDMVSSMVSQVVIPRLCKLIEGGALDPYSTRHIRRMIDIAEQVEASVEQSGLRFQSLLKSVSTVFQDVATSLHTLLSPSLGPTNVGPPFDPQSVPARRRFLIRRLKLLTNLIKWRKYTGERFGLGEVATSLIQRCILPVAERGWEVGGEELMRKMVEITPSELVPVEVTTRLR
ncbi:nineteen complex-related protein 2-domain-containing protein [Hysterangium stoloniferum]|nr:nineteen complex-related protein 2-domain-containing protein [Hysterangium stoloniferum]